CPAALICFACSSNSESPSKENVPFGPGCSRRVPWPPAMSSAATSPFLTASFAVPASFSISSSSLLTKVTSSTVFMSTGFGFTYTSSYVSLFSSNGCVSNCDSTFCWLFCSSLSNCGTHFVIIALPPYFCFLHYNPIVHTL